MLKLGLRFNRRDFEYDIYALIKAFYPESEITLFYTDEQPDDQSDAAPGAAGKPESAYDANGAGMESTSDGAAKALMDYDLGFAIEYGSDQTCFLICADGQICTEKRFALPEESARTLRKNALKRQVYQALAARVGRTLPWGDLTGIRPTKIATAKLLSGKSPEETATYMQDTYGVSPEKSALAVAVANREREVLRGFDYKDGYSLYVGIPFCTSICLYCSFGSHRLSSYAAMVEPYLTALFRELEFIARQMRGRHLCSVYIGGGTPTTLSAAQLKRLLSKITENFDLSGCMEFTVEAGRPDTIDEEKLRVMRKFPVSRISINPQTMNEQTLAIIGRAHTPEDIIRTYTLARSCGFDNINMDLIVGLPGEGIEEVRHTLDEIRTLSPDGLTIHSLALKRATRLHLHWEEYLADSFRNSAEIMHMTERSAAAMEMRPYYLYRQKNMAGNFENVGYAKSGKSGIYNILIMEEKQTIMAAGCGASTKFVFEDGGRIERVENVKDLKNYVERIDEMLERKRNGIRKYLQGEEA